MKKYLCLPLIFCFIVLLQSCKMNVLKGEGKKTTVSPAVTSFAAMDVGVTLKVVVNMREGSQASVQLSGYENVLKHIKTKVEHNTLRVYSDLDETWTMNSDDVVLEVTLPSITALKLEGASDADIHGNITGSEFALDIAGASTVLIDNVSADNFSVDAAGASDVTIKGGNVKHATYDIAGAGELKAFPLHSMETTATISGAGTCSITVEQKLTADISGAGTVKYKGHPQIAQEIAGAGTVADAN